MIDEMDEIAAAFGIRFPRLASTGDILWAIRELEAENERLDVALLEAQQMFLDEQEKRQAAEAELAEYEKWFNKNASVLSVLHRIGGFKFEQEQTK